MNKDNLVQLDKFSDLPFYSKIAKVWEDKTFTCEYIDGVELIHGIGLDFVCAISKGKNVLEIGTFKGATTFNLAKNANKVITVDCGVNGTPDNYGYYTVGEYFINKGFSNIEQVLCKSQDFDFKSYKDYFDFIIVDGAHTYELCKIDILNAVECVKDGGIVYIDDYPNWEGVVKAVHELSDKLKFYAVSGKDFDNKYGNNPVLFYYKI
jgi:predicted O-methyltransferase YrrM